MKKPLVLVATLACALPVFAAAQQPTPAAPAAAGMSAPLADGEVVKVDADAGKVTLRHGPIANLEMQPMTMVFHVADPKWLGTLKPGDRIKFYADRQGGKIVLTNIIPAQ